MYFCGMCAHPLRDQPAGEDEVIGHAAAAAAATVRKTLGVEATPRTWRKTQRGTRSEDSELRRKRVRYESRAAKLGFKGHTDRYDKDDVHRGRMDEEGIPRVL